LKSLGKKAAWKTLPLCLPISKPWLVARWRTPQGAGRKEKISSDVENLVLKTRSEQTGYAVSICRGRMEIWNAGFSGMGSIFILMARIRT